MTIFTAQPQKMLRGRCACDNTGRRQNFVVMSRQRYLKKNVDHGWYVNEDRQPENQPSWQTDGQPTSRTVPRRIDRQTNKLLLRSHSSYSGKDESETFPLPFCPLHMMWWRLHVSYHKLRMLILTDIWQKNLNTNLKKM